MSIHLRSLKIEVNTNEKPMSAHLIFSPKGLNIVRAENSMGKSTCVQAIIYALGLESMLVMKHEIPLPPSVKSLILDESGLELPVESSCVLLEIENDAGKIVTLRRYIKMDGKNYKLIEVFDGALLTKNTPAPNEPDEYYVRMPGSAKNELGFHNWLERFLNWSLPQVALNNNNFTKLYIESIAPLFIIEQKTGWGQIQANTPHFQIRDVKKRVIEFVLGLDAYKNYQDFLKIKSDLEIGNERWRSRVGTLERQAQAVGGALVNLPRTAPEVFDESILPTISFNVENSRLDLSSFINYIETELAKKKNQFENNVEGLSKELRVNLDELQRKLGYQDKYIHQMDAELRRLKIEIHSNEDSISEFKHEASYLHDLKRIQSLGGTKKFEVDHSQCPTCSQKISGTVLTKDADALYMTVDESIDFLKSEIKTIEAINESLNIKFKSLESERSHVSQEMSEVRTQIRLIKDTLVESGKAPSRITYHQIFKYEEQLKELAILKEDFETAIAYLKDLHIEIVLLEKKLQSIDDFLSSTDREKLNYLKKSLKRQLKNYGFNSFNINDLNISEVSYHPALADIDWYFDVSASDNVRGIWAYNLAVHETCFKYHLKHYLGFTIFDEPKQHSAKGESFKAFLQECSAEGAKGLQTIVFTSESEEDIKDFKEKEHIKFLNYPEGERIIS